MPKDLSWIGSQRSGLHDSVCSAYLFSTVIDVNIAVIEVVIVLGVAVVELLFIITCICVWVCVCVCVRLHIWLHYLILQSYWDNAPSKTNSTWKDDIQGNTSCNHLFRRQQKPLCRLKSTPCSPVCLWAMWTLKFLPFLLFRADGKGGTGGSGTGGRGYGSYSSYSGTYYGVGGGVLTSRAAFASAGAFGAVVLLTSGSRRRYGTYNDPEDSSQCQLLTDTLSNSPQYPTMSKWVGWLCILNMKMFDHFVWSCHVFWMLLTADVSWFFLGDPFEEVLPVLWADFGSSIDFNCESKSCGLPKGWRWFCMFSSLHVSPQEEEMRSACLNLVGNETLCHDCIACGTEDCMYSISNCDEYLSTVFRECCVSNCDPEGGPGESGVFWWHSASPEVWILKVVHHRLNGGTCHLTGWCYK